MTEAFDPFAIHTGEEEEDDDRGTSEHHHTDIIQNTNTQIHNDINFANFQDLTIDQGEVVVQKSPSKVNYNNNTNAAIEAFEPFVADFENGFSPSTSMATDIQSDMFPMNTTRDSFNSSFISRASGVNASDISINSGMLPSLNNSKSFTSQSPNKTKRKKISLNMTIHEEMSCMFDHSVSSEIKSMSIEGKVHMILPTELQGQSIYLSIHDSQKHIATLIPYFDVVTEHRLLNQNDLHVPFVMSQHQKGHRVYRVNIPSNLDTTNLSSTPINILQYTASENLRPIPILIHSKVRLAGKYCRLEIKIRSNPINKGPIENVILLIAVPPDINGETLKTSKKGAVWDSMKRVVVWSVESIQSGETIQMQLQFELLNNDGIKSDDTYLPTFPLLLRCASQHDLLSSIKVLVGENAHSSENGIVMNPVDLALTQSYRLFHRKL